MPTSGDLRSGDCPLFTTPSPPPPSKNWSSPQWEWLRTLYDVLHYVHTIKIWNHRFDAGNNLCQWLNTCKNAPETVLQIRKIIQVLSWKWAKSQTKSVLFFTKYSIFTVDVKLKVGHLCTKAGERETRQKSVSLPPKAGELAPLHLGVANGTSKNVGLEKFG